jgi:hypothetical protein
MSRVLASLPQNSKAGAFEGTLILPISATGGYRIAIDKVDRPEDDEVAMALNETKESW